MIIFREENRAKSLRAPREGKDFKPIVSKFPFWHQVIDYLNFDELTKISAVSSHLMNEATQIIPKFEQED